MKKHIRIEIERGETDSAGYLFVAIETGENGQTLEVSDGNKKLFIDDANAAISQIIDTCNSYEKALAE